MLIVGRVGAFLHVCDRGRARFYAGSARKSNGDDALGRRHAVVHASFFPPSFVCRVSEQKRERKFERSS